MTIKPKIEMLGRKFGHLTVCAATDPLRNGSRLTAAWLCVCDCGADRIVAGVELRRGRITGCSQRKGRVGTAEHRAYHAMKSRCRNLNNDDYADYGGRGITVCDRWLYGHECKSGLECFIADMGEKPSPELSLDRIDVNGPYSPENCRWATPAEQARNKRDSLTIKLDGQTLPLVAAAAHIGISYSLVINRIHQDGMSITDALLTPVRHRARGADGRIFWK